ncbi:rolling circle replication-associated protein, partial [Enterococcus casseliflavus]
MTVYKNALIVKIDDDSIDVSISEKTEKTDDEKELEKIRNLWKIRTKIKDYVLSNEFNYFWTLTFDSDRYNYAVAFEKMGRWLERMRKKHGKFDYIMIPELHKDGAIHFHGVTGGLNAVIRDSGVKHKGVKVYNCSDWDHGFTTLTKIRSREKTASYITKYVTKEMQNSIVGKGKKKYWCSRGLRVPAVEYSVQDLGLGLQPDYENDTCLIYKI